MSATGQVAVVDPSGKVTSVAAADVQQAQLEGYTLATPEELASEAERQQYGGATGVLAAGAAGALRGASFGTSDYALGQLGYAQDLAALRRHNPLASGLGEVAGVVAPALLSGGESLVGTVAEGLGTPVRLVEGAAGLAERGAAGLLGAEATSIGGRAFQGAARSGVRGAVEGAAYGAGGQLTEDVLGGHEVTAEKLLAGAGHGALLGGAIMGAGGGLLGATGGLVDAGLTRGRKLAGDLMERGGGQDALIARGRAWAEDQAGQQAFKASGAKVADWQKLGGTSAEQTARAGKIGRTLLDEELLSTAGREQTSANVVRKLNQVGEDLGALRRQMDEATATGANLGLRPDRGTIVSRVEREVLAPLDAMPGMEAESSYVRRYIDSFAEKMPERPTFERLAEARISLDKKLKYDQLTAGSSVEQLRLVRGILENELEGAAAKASEAIGGDLAAKYKTAKALYSELATAKKILAKETARDASRRAVSLTDTMSGGNGAKIGAGIGALVGGAPGAFAGAALGGLAGGMVNKTLRERGNFFAAQALDKAARFKSIQEATALVDKRILNGVERFFDAAKRGAVQAGHAAERTGFEAVGQATAKDRAAREKAAAAAVSLASSPQAMAAATAKLGGGLAQEAPRTAMALSMTQARAITFLASKAPPRPPSTNRILALQGVSLAPSHADLAKFGRYLDTINDPVMVLSLARQGRLTAEHMDALRSVYPQLHAEIVNKVAAEASTRAHDLTYNQRVHLSVLLGQPVDATMDPKFIASVQATKAPPAAQSAQDAPSKPGHTVDLSAASFSPPSESIGQAS